MPQDSTARKRQKARRTKKLDAWRAKNNDALATDAKAPVAAPAEPKADE